MKKIFFPLSILVLSIIFLAQPATSLAAPLKLNINLEKPYFTTTETVNIKATVLNSSQNIKKHNRIILTVYDRLFYEENIGDFKYKKKKALFRRYWYKNLNRGETEFSFKKELSNTHLAEGVYPIRFKVELSDNQTITKNSFLILINKKERALPVALVWNWSDPPLTTVNSGIYKSSWLQRFGTEENPGLYYQYLDKVSQFPNLKLNIALAPLMLDELKSLPDNGKIKKLGKVRQVADEEQSQASANTFLNKLKKTILDNKGIELIPTPYAYPSLPFLSFQNWDKDITKQLIMGKKTIKSIFDENYDYQGLFAPDMDLDINSAERLSESGVKYSIIGRDRLIGRASTLVPRSLQLKKKRSLTVFIADSQFEQLLAKTSKEELQLKLSAFFAKRFFDSEKKSGALTAVFSANSYNRLTPEKLEILLRFINDTPWLQPNNVKELYEHIPATKDRLKKWLPTKRLDNSYVKSLILTRLNIADFNKSIDMNNPLRRALEKKLLTAENNYWLQQKDINISISKNYLREIDDIIDLSFNNIKIPPRQNITFSSKKGKIPIAITNQNNYPVKVTIKFVGDKDFSFIDDKIKKITIMPKNNLIVYKVKARYTGSSNMNINLYSGNRLIAKEKLTVMVSDVTKYILRIISALSLIIIAALIFRKRQGV